MSSYVITCTTGKWGQETEPSHTGVHIVRVLELGVGRESP